MKTNKVRQEIWQITERLRYYKEVSERFIGKLQDGSSLTRDENPESHFCVYFVPYDPKEKRVFIGNHKKSGLWLMPGGHIDHTDKTIDAAVRREIKEELNWELPSDVALNPFLITRTVITNPKQTCKEHLDMWYLISTASQSFEFDTREFSSARWMSLRVAKRLVTDPASKQALVLIEECK